ncbi:TetR/AcrR family transcriptional regulator [Zhongshania sp.]|uniref:TetR/AcrR family transcriptional regulator n=1 Tax=Zhongshania sp. TaxID=1971902 RepID=UPI001B6BFC52|nr:TetR/AcrR family transcriptional regulator [Zhongshania sp.]MBQ0794874.1 TetR/AcrR family transcriptional regulator [Zhongshania sp.]
MEAVTSCIKLYGLEKTTMDNIAEQAGLSRITVYRKYSNRNNLINSFLAYRAEQFNSKIKTKIEDCTSLEQALEMYFWSSAEQAFKDESVRVLVETTHVYKTILNGDDSPIKAAISDTWSPLLDKLSAADANIRSIDKSEVINWIIVMQHNFSSMAIETDCTEEQIRRYIRDFVIPAFIIKTRG